MYVKEGKILKEKEEYYHRKYLSFTVIKLKKILTIKNKFFRNGRGPYVL